MKLPEHYQTVMPYLIVPDAAVLIDFCKTVFDAHEYNRHPDDNGRIMHAEIGIGNSTIMIGESTQEWTPQPAGLYINVDDADQRYQQALDAGATSIMPPNNQPYGRTCGVKDTSGNTWWITSGVE